MTDTPVQPADTSPRRRTPGLVLLLVAAALGGGGAVAYAAMRNGPPAARTEPSTSTAAAATSTPPVMLSERDACVKLNPLLVRSSEMYAAYAKDMTTPSRDEASTLRAELREVQKVAPADMSPDIGQVMKGVSLLPAGGAGINFDDWQQAGLNLATRCLGAS